MATYSPEDGEGDLFSCPICFEDYSLQEALRAPKLLLCLHTFCFECMKKLWKKDGSLECSMCRMLHKRVDLDELFDNPVIIERLQQEREERDLEVARMLDQEYQRELGRNQASVQENVPRPEDRGVEPLESSDGNDEDEFSEPIVPNDTIELDSEDNVDLDITDSPALEPNHMDMEDDREEEEEDEEEEEEEEAQERNDLEAQMLQALCGTFDGAGSDVDEESSIEEIPLRRDVADETRQDDSIDDVDPDDVGSRRLVLMNNFQNLLQEEFEEEAEDVEYQEELDDEGEEEEEEEEEEEDEEEVEDEELEEESEGEGDLSETFSDNRFLLIGDTEDVLFGDAEDAEEEEEEEEEEDDERFHSACDDFTPNAWEESRDLPLRDGSGDANKEAFRWQKVKETPLMED